jgi:hypothetical protein
VIDDMLFPASQLKFTNSHVAELDIVGLSMILKAQKALERSVFEGRLVQLRVNNLLSIELDL